jgi:hypothetical protein
MDAGPLFKLGPKRLHNKVAAQRALAALHRDDQQKHGAKVLLGPELFN